MDSSTAPTTHFGRQTVPTAQKQALVRGVFDTVASRYDLMNDAMSGGLHRWWKNEMVAAIPLYPSMALLDLAGGTGDIAFRFLDRVAAQNESTTGHHPAVHAEVSVCDINAAMLGEGKKRALDQNRRQHLQWICGNAEHLPFDDNSQDACTIAFGIRNVTDIPQALRDIHRVLKPGGKFLCLEFSTVQHPLLRRIYDEYSTHVIPRMGALLAGEAAPYTYLVESIRNFPEPDDFAAMIAGAGFGQASYRLMTGGVVALHSGWKR